MRLYGSSPLYSYVELVFRCRRMFVISVILGTAVMSAVMALRADQYQTMMVIALTGNPEVVNALNPGGPETNPAVAGATRKARRLIELWLPEDPDFLPDTLKAIGLDRKYARDFDGMVRKVRGRVVVDPQLIGGQYMRVNLTWEDAREAERILNALYQSFAQRTVAEETATQTNQRLLLDRAFRVYDERANKVAAERVKYLARYYNQMPGMIAAMMQNLDKVNNDIQDTQTNAADYRARLTEIAAGLRRTERYITGVERTIDVPEDAAAPMVAERADLEKQLQGLRQRWSEAHPAILEMKRKIADLERRISEERQKPRTSRPTQIDRTRTINPEYQQLVQTLNYYQQSLRAADRRLTKLETDRADLETRVRAMPAQEVAYNRIETNYRYAITVRDQIRSKLSLARFEEERDRFTQGQAVKLEVAPRTERVEGGGKRILMFGLGPVLGILVAFVFSLLAESLDRTIRTPVEVERFLGKPVLAVIPRLRHVGQSRRRLGDSGNTRRLMP